MTAPLEPLAVAEGVAMLPLRTPTIPPAEHTNAYLVGTRELVLVEPASPYEDEIARSVSWVEQRLATGGTLRAIVLTHHHPDHVGGAAALRRRFGAPVWAHARTAERLADKLAIDRLIDDGDRIELDGPTPLVLEPMHTPGHAHGHLCFFEPASRSLIAGDMVASVGTILVDPTDGDMQLYLASLRAMRERDATQLLPAHGMPIRDPRDRLDFYVRHRLAREAKIHAALAAAGRPLSLDALLPVAYDDASRAVWPIARLSLEAHLVKLAREGRAERTAGGYRACA